MDEYGRAIIKITIIIFERKNNVIKDHCNILNINILIIAGL